MNATQAATARLAETNAKALRSLLKTASYETRHRHYLTDRIARCERQWELFWNASQADINPRAERALGAVERLQHELEREPAAAEAGPETPDDQLTPDWGMTIRLTY